MVMGFQVFETSDTTSPCLHVYGGRCEHTIRESLNAEEMLKTLFKRTYQVTPSYSEDKEKLSEFN